MLKIPHAERELELTTAYRKVDPMRAQALFIAGYAVLPTASGSVRCTVTRARVFYGTPVRVRARAPHPISPHSTPCDNVGYGSDADAGANRTPTMTATTKPSRSALSAVSEAMITLFPIWAVGASVCAYLYPSIFVNIGPNVVRAALAGVMLSTGLTITGGELRQAAARPGVLTLGLLGCFVGMPLLALGLSALFALPAPYHAGLVLLGAVSGGQMSNLCTSIARGDAALSVAMTTASTLAAAVALPTLAQLLLGAAVPVDAVALAISTASFVLAPVLVGAAFSEPAKPLRPVLPLAGIVLVLVLVVGPVAQTAPVIASALRALAAPVIALHVLGGAIAYAIAKAAKRGEAFARAVAFEMGFKSPALSYVLTQAHFANPAVALPSAVSIVTLAPLGALFAVLFRLFPPKEDDGISPTTETVDSRSLPVENSIGTIERTREVVILDYRKPTSTSSSTPAAAASTTATVVPKAEQLDVKVIAIPKVNTNTTISQELQDKKAIVLDEAQEAWRSSSDNSTGTVTNLHTRAPLTTTTRFKILVQDRETMYVHYGALEAKLKSLRRRGSRILGVEQVELR